NSDPNPHGDSNRHTDFNSDADADPDAHADTKSKSNSNSNPNAHSDAYSDAQSNPSRVRQYLYPAKCRNWRQRSDWLFYCHWVSSKESYRARDRHLSGRESPRRLERSLSGGSRFYRQDHRIE